MYIEKIPFEELTIPDLNFPTQHELYLDLLANSAYNPRKSERETYTDAWKTNNEAVRPPRILEAERTNGAREAAPLEGQLRCPSSVSTAPEKRGYEVPEKTNGRPMEAPFQEERSYPSDFYGPGEAGDALRSRASYGLTERTERINGPSSYSESYEDRQHRRIKESLPIIEEHSSISRLKTTASISTPIRNNTPKRSLVRQKFVDNVLFDNERYSSSKRVFDAKKQSITRKIPSLRELESSRLEASIRYDYDDEKRELMFKLELLQKKYPLRTIPQFTLRSDYKTMLQTYDIILKQLNIDSSVESFKNYLVGGFMVCEMVFGKIGFDMDGFTQQQLLSMGTYEKLLIELGEKSYIPMGMDKYPVEVRLALTIFFNAVLFVGAKLILKKTKINILQLFNEVKQTASSVTANPVTKSSPLTFITKKTEGPYKMKGPKDEGFESS